MRRYYRSLTMILIVTVVAVLVLAFQTFSVGNFERGDDTLLGLRLGLDLQGGTHLVYQAVDRETGLPIIPEPRQMEALERSINDRVNASGIGEPNIQILGEDRLLVQLPGVRDPDRAERLIGQTAQLEFKHRELNVARPLEGISIEEDIVSVSAGPLPEPEPEEAEEGETGTPTPEPTPDPAESDAPPVLIVEFTEESASRFQAVVDQLQGNLAQAIVEAETAIALEIAIEGNAPLKDIVPGFAIQRIEGTNSFAFPFPFPETSEPGLAEAELLLGDAAVVRDMTEILTFVDKVPEYGALTGDDLDRAYPDQHAQTSQPIVVLEFKSRGTRIWGQLTSDLYLKQDTDRIAIFLDGEELIAPVVNAPITTGTTIIEGGRFTIESSQDLALQLQSGALPLTIERIQRRDVDAILGADSLNKSVVAGLIGLVLVLMFMVLYYRVPGLVSAVALLIYAAVVLSVFKLIPITLTLSGVAAVILSIGMAVDANILIFERMKEELRTGRTMLSAVNIGFSRAWPAIRDGNVSTLITCGILFYFSNQLGTTVVQGFAVALAVGVLISLFTAVVVSRTFLRTLALTRLARQPQMFVPAGGSELPQRAAGS